MGSNRQWDTDWFDQFKTILATDISTLAIYPGTPLYWCERKDIAFGQKQIQPKIRMPDQRVHVSQEVEYVDKYAKRIVQVADLPSITDSLRVEEEYYANDPVNALGHVGDITENFPDGLAQHYIVGESIDPLSYGLIDAGAGTGSTTVTRPDKIADVSTSGDSDTPANLLKDLANLDNALSDNGFFGKRIICTHPKLRPFLKLLPMSYTVTPYNTYITQIGGYEVDYCQWYDSNATTDAIDIFMVDASAFRIYQTPLIMRSFWDEKTEHYYWRMKTRGVLLPKKVTHDGTDWKKGIVKCALDIYD